MMVGHKRSVPCRQLAVMWKLSVGLALAALLAGPCAAVQGELDGGESDFDSALKNTPPMPLPLPPPRHFYAHTNNHAVLVCTSTYWFNYRHIANVLSIYRLLRWLGMPDSNIVLMMADDMACNGRNLFPAAVFNSEHHDLNVYGDDVEVDYRGSEVTVENFIRVLTDRLPIETSRSKRLVTDSRSNVLVYMTGHGGDNFLKFQDTEEINAQDLADAFEQMHEKGRYNEILFMIDTCQASTMFEKIRSPEILAIASSVRNESSYSHHVDDVIGVAVIDRFTYAILQYMKDVDRQSEKTLADLIASWDTDFLGSHPSVRTDLCKRKPSEIRIVEFFGNVQSYELTFQRYELVASKRAASPPPNPPSQSHQKSNANPQGPYELKLEAQTSVHVYIISAILIFISLYIFGKHVI